MTNGMIIFNAQIELMEQGKIGTTGRVLKVQYEDGEKTFPEPEAIHTFNWWKQNGYKVRKGEHAVAALMIWKYITSKKADDEEAEEADGKCYLKKAYFFSQAQVDRIN